MVNVCAGWISLKLNELMLFYALDEDYAVGQEFVRTSVCFYLFIPQSGSPKLLLMM